MKRKAFEVFVGWISELYGTAFRNHFPAKNRLCRSGRELDRVGEIMISRIKPLKKEARFLEWGRYRKFQDFLRTIVLIWEFDNSYRFRGQDVFSELNKDNLRINPRKEIMRLFTIGLQRERAGLSEKDKEALRKSGAEFFDVAMKWKLILKLLKTVLFFSKDFTKLFADFFNELTIEEFKFDEGDWYWVCERCDYDFGGKSFTERLLERLRIDEEYFKTLPPSQPPQAQVVMIPNEEFYLLPRAQAEHVVGGLLKQVWEGFEKKKKAEGLTN